MATATSPTANSGAAMGERTPVVRVMAEGADEPVVRQVVDDIVESIESCAGAA